MTHWDTRIHLVIPLLHYDIILLYYDISLLHYTIIILHYDVTMPLCDFTVLHCVLATVDCGVTMLLYSMRVQHVTPLYHIVLITVPSQWSVISSCSMCSLSHDNDFFDITLFHWVITELCWNVTLLHWVNILTCDTMLKCATNTLHYTSTILNCVTTSLYYIIKMKLMLSQWLKLVIPMLKCVIMRLSCDITMFHCTITMLHWDQCNTDLWHQDALVFLNKALLALTMPP